MTAFSTKNFIDVINNGFKRLLVNQTSNIANQTFRALVQQFVKAKNVLKAVKVYKLSNLISLLGLEVVSQKVLVDEEVELHNAFLNVVGGNVAELLVAHVAEVLGAQKSAHPSRVDHLDRGFHVEIIGEQVLHDCGFVHAFGELLDVALRKLRVP